MRGALQALLTASNEGRRRTSRARLDLSDASHDGGGAGGALLAMLSGACRPAPILRLAFFLVALGGRRARQQQHDQARAEPGNSKRRFDGSAGLHRLIDSAQAR